MQSLNCAKVKNSVTYVEPNLIINVKSEKVKGHYHFTRKYQSAAHNICNLRYAISQEINIFMHNSSDYDFQLIIKRLADKFENGSTEKYMFYVSKDKNMKKYREKQMKKVSNIESTNTR